MPKNLDKDISYFKSSMAKFVGASQVMSGLFTSDKEIKATVAIYIFQHYKIANYYVLQEAANEIGEFNIANIFEGILKKEEEMAVWIKNYMPNITQQFLRKTI